MSKRRVGLHEISYELMSKAEARAPHFKTTMMSGNSRGPVKMWVCPNGRCGEVVYTYGASLEAPECFGGVMWSFTTASGFDPRLHHPRALGR